MSAYTERTALLLGDEALARLQHATVAVIGLGGVGGTAAEALARTGVGRLHLVDNDTVTPSNLNRQIFATKDAIGLPKTLAARRRIEAVSDCIVTTADLFVTAETVQDALPPDCDFVLDAIDSLAGKVALACCCTEKGIPMVACMGAGNRLDATAFSVRDVYETSNCPLARRYRQALRKAGVMKMPCVVSSETAQKSAVIASIAPVTGAAGLVAAGYCIQVLTQIQSNKGETR